MSTPPSFNPIPCGCGGESHPCGQPVQFCQNSTSTGPVEYPGRMYDLTLPINQGFSVDQLLVDSTTHNAGIVWSVLDADGSDFAEELRVFLEGRLPAAAVVTITNPNENQEVCGDAQPFQIHIECLRLEDNPPNLIELVYNAGSDKILNPAYRPLNSFTSSATRQDNGGTILCTNTPNRGWETNDQLEAFEFWGPANATPVGAVTPTPRGTPVQEINANGSGLPSPNSGSTIWQTFEVTPAEAGSTFNLRVVVGGRAGTEQIRIRLFAGDEPNPGTAPGGLIDTTLSAPKVAPPERNPWTNYSNDLPLGPGLYTLAFTGPDTTSIGGLFTDMRAFIDRPGRRATATTNDETCVVTVDETTTNTVCSFWSPVCEGGQIESWTNVETQVTLTNDEFWAQTPSPSCCLPAAAAEGGGGGGQSNMAVSDVVCATVGGIPQNAIRTVVLDPSGGQLAEEFLSTDGSRITPASWQPGQCTTLRYLADVVLCDVDPGTGEVITSFLRKYVQTWSQEDGARVTESRDFTLDGLQIYTPVGVAQDCEAGNRPFTMTGLCLPDGTPIGTVYHRAGNTPAMDGWVNLRTGTFTAGAPPAGTVSCASGQSIQTTGVFCVTDDGTGDVLELVLIEYTYGPDGAIDSTRIVRAEDGSTYVIPAGSSLDVCPAGTDTPSSEAVLLCDQITPGIVNRFIRDFRRDENGVIVGFSDYNFDGTPYTVTGTIEQCDVRLEFWYEQEVFCDDNGIVLVDYRRRSNGMISSVSFHNSVGVPIAGPTGPLRICPNTSTVANVRDSETLILCDAAGTRFQRTTVRNELGAIVATVDQTFAGAPFTPSGAVGVCATTTTPEVDVQQEILCDANGTTFLRRWLFNSATGVVTATQNLTLAGAAFTPVGAVGLCSNCCPTVVAEVCVGPNREAGVVIRNADGTLTRLNTVTGGTFVPGDIVDCTAPLSAQHQDVTPGSPWTPPGGVVLTSLTYTVLVGTATVTDQNGTSVAGIPAGFTASWTHQEEGVLQPPQSVTADASSRVLVTWTQR